MAPVTIVDSQATDLVQAMHDAAVPEIEFIFAYRQPEEDDLLLVAWVEDQPVGYVAATRSPDGVEVWEHAVVPTHRHRGVGRLLLAEVARRVDPGSIIRIDPAHQLDLERLFDYYARCGFTHEARNGDLWATATEVIRANEPAIAVDVEHQVKALLRAKGTSLVLVPPTATVRQAVDLLNEHRIGALPVSSDRVRLEGLLSDRDILAGLGQQGAAFLDRTVGEVMGTDAVTCSATDSLPGLMALMTRRRIRHLPVLDGPRLVGIVSLGDVVAHHLDQLERRPAAV